MTLIECFVNSPLENIATALCLKPQKIIFIGNAKNPNLIIDKYRKILKSKKIEPEFDFKKTAVGSFRSAEKILKDVIACEKECILDITGGQENVLMAAGALYNEFKDKNSFKILRYDSKTSLMVDAVTGQKNIGTRAWLAVDKLISLHGGLVTSSGSANFSKSDKLDLDMLWDVVCENPEQWNDGIRYLHEFENKSSDDNSANDFYLNFNTLKEKVKDFEQKKLIAVPLLQRLSQKGILINYIKNANSVCYEYKNPFVKDCIKKEGNLLELKTYSTALDLKDQNGEKFFDDCKMSVSIDWDGKVHGREEPIKDTSNEIDVILMRNCKALFISCKNGDIKEVELYKLSTVASRFAGKFAEKVLISTEFTQGDDNSKESFRQRTKDMGVSFGENVAKFTDEDWERFLKSFY